MKQILLVLICVAQINMVLARGPEGGPRKLPEAFGGRLHRNQFEPRHRDQGHSGDELARVPRTRKPVTSGSLVGREPENGTAGISKKDDTEAAELMMNGDTDYSAYVTDDEIQYGVSFKPNGGRYKNPPGDQDDDDLMTEEEMTPEEKRAKRRVQEIRLSIEEEAERLGINLEEFEKNMEDPNFLPNIEKENKDATTKREEEELAELIQVEERLEKQIAQKEGRISNSQPGRSWMSKMSTGISKVLTGLRRLVTGTKNDYRYEEPTKQQIKDSELNDKENSELDKRVPGGNSSSRFTSEAYRNLRGKEAYENALRIRDEVANMKAE